MRENKFATVISLMSLFILVFFYEWFVKAWSVNEIGAVIRVDIIIVYPIILSITFATFFLLKKIRKTKSKLLFTIVFILFLIVFAGIFKFNILSNIEGNDVDENPIELEQSKISN